MSAELTKDYSEKGKYLILEEHRVDGVLLGVVRVDKDLFLTKKQDILKEKGQRGYDKYLKVLLEAGLIDAAQKLAAEEKNLGP